MSGYGIGGLNWIDPDDELDLLDEEGNPLTVLDEDAQYAETGVDWTPEEDDDEGAIYPPPVEDWAQQTDDPWIGPSVNLVPHSSFESNRDWSVGQRWTVPYATSDAFHGTRVARFQRVATDGPGGDLVSATISVDVGTTYWLSFMSWVVSRSSGAGRVILRQWDGNGVFLQDIVITEVTELNTGWSRVADRIGPRAPTQFDFVWHPETTSAAIIFQTVGAAVMEWLIDGVQLEAGMSSVYAPAPNEDIPGDEVEPGTLPPEAFDTTPPSVPVITSVTSEAILDADGKPVVVMHVGFDTLPPESDYAGIEVHATATSTLDDPDDPSSPRSPDWTSGRLFTFLPTPTKVGTVTALADVIYWVRANSIDTQGNRSAFSDTVEFLTSKDGSAPGVPDGIATAGIFKGMVVSWSKSSAPDLSTYEVRYRIEGSGDPWAVLRVRGTVVSITDLVATEDSEGLPATTYEAQVRAIDTSNQVATSTENPMAVDAVANPEAGWSASVTGQPTLVGSVDIAAGSIVAGHVRAGGITTDKLGAGEIIVNTTTDTAHPDGISVRSGAGDDAPELIRIDEDGIIIWAGGDNHTDYLHMDAGSLSLVKGDVTQVAITPDGIDATAISFGTAPGGHNLVFNSSFELNGATAAPSTITDTAAADWSGSRVGSLDNLTEGASALSVTGTGF